MIIFFVDVISSNILLLACIHANGAEMRDFLKYLFVSMRVCARELASNKM
jgi:hypothetical protein